MRSVGDRWEQRRGLLWTLSFCALLVGSSASRTPAATVVIQVRAYNPSVTDAQVVTIREYLPKGIDPQTDVISTGGLEIGYDVQEALYYVHAELTLETNTFRTYNVELQDVWTIDPEVLDGIKSKSGRHVEQLTNSKYRKTAERLKSVVDKNLERVRATQEKNSLIRGTKPIEHIRAHELNMMLMERITEDLGHIENLVISAGLDPEKIEGQTTRPPTPRDEWALDKADYPTAVLSFTVKNTGTNSRVLPIRQDLPVELRSDDVTPPEGLAVGFDDQKRVIFVFSEGIEFGAQESRVFEIQVRDKWGIPPERTRDLHTRTTNLAAMISEVESFPALDSRLEEILAMIDGVEASDTPAALTAEYVAFGRRQAEDLADIEQKIMSIEELLEKRVEQSPDVLKVASDVFKTKAPDKKTTWIIIYTILVFLGIVSVMFFLRWSGRSRSEQMPKKADSLDAADE